MIKEKRRFTRFSFRAKAELTIHGASHIIEEIENLSIGGCLLSIDEDLGTGEECDLKIMLGNEGEGPVVNIKGVVVRRNRGKVAIEFTAIDPESLHHLHQIARYNSNAPDRVDQEIMKHPGIL